MNRSAEPSVFPVLIPSKGRPDPCPTAERLEQAGIPFRLVVEPQDADRYLARWGREALLVMGEDDRGLAYARNFLLDRIRRERPGWAWMLDDDITGFYRVEAGKCVQAGARAVLEGAQAVFAGRDDVAQAALEYRQFAWAAPKDVAEGGYCDVAVCVHSARIGRIRCREDVDVKLDRDFTLQLLADGWNTVRTCRWAFSCPKNGSNPGGLHDVYAEPGREAAASREMERLWGPEVCRAVTKSDGRPDVKINWKRLRRPP